MLRRFRGVFLLVGLFAGFMAPSFGVADIRFGFSLSGGAGRIDGGDFNRSIRDVNAYASDYNFWAGEDQYSVDWEEMTWLPKFGGELNLRFGRYFGLGLGAEYIRKSNPGSVQRAFQDSAVQDYGTYYVRIEDIYELTEAYEQTLTVVPITLSAYGYLPLGAGFEAFVRAGVGYYLGTLSTETSSEAEDVLSQLFYWNSGAPKPPHFHVVARGKGDGSWEATSRTVGFHFGAGFSATLSGSIAVFGEAFYRQANFDDWRGSGAIDYLLRQDYGWTYSTEPANLPSSNTISGSESVTGQLWSYEEIYGLETGAYLEYTMFDDSDVPEETPWIRNVRPTEINLNGFFFKAGIRIFFGSRNVSR